MWFRILLMWFQIVFKTPFYTFQHSVIRWRRLCWQCVRLFVIVYYKIFFFSPRNARVIWPSWTISSAAAARARRRGSRRRKTRLVNILPGHVIRERDIDREREGEREKEKERQRERRRERKREREIEREEREREKEREKREQRKRERRDRKRNRDRKRDRERVIHHFQFDVRKPSMNRSFRAPQEIQRSNDESFIQLVGLLICWFIDFSPPLLVHW